MVRVLFFVVVGVVVLADLWLVVIALKENVLWGLLIAIFPPAAIVFVVMHWEVARLPFFVWLPATVLMLFLVFTQTAALGPPADAGAKQGADAVATAVFAYQDAGKGFPTGVDQLVSSGFLTATDSVDPWGTPYGIYPWGGRAVVWSKGPDKQDGEGFNEDNESFSFVEAP